MDYFSYVTKSIDVSDDFKYITGLIIQPNVVDYEGHYFTEQAIEKAANDFLKEKKLQIGKNHYKISDDLSMVQSRVLENEEIFNDVVIKKGSWVGKFEILTDKLKDEIKEGKYNGFSIGGKGGGHKKIKKSKNIDSKFNELTEISVLKVNEISIVDIPANETYFLSLSKRKDKMDFEDIKKSFSEDKDLFNKLLSEFNLTKKDENKNDDEIELLKSASPALKEFIKKQNEKMEKIEKAQKETKRKEFETNFIEIKKHMAIDESLEETLLNMYLNDDEKYIPIEKAFKCALSTIKNKDDFESVGADNPEDKTTTDLDKYEIEAIKILKSKPNLTKEQAYAMAMDAK
ncbi:XkdF-like putative serine protease domain-containing protein [Silvanigrella sp.]|jgi:hypothetical protein|uniref:XkdF-like putative serine protease domain-containing protein n=1 Tax=Silvanigrella sp. TaxID=2024976 RepID=UPI0037CBDCBF